MRDKETEKRDTDETDSDSSYIVVVLPFNILPSTQGLQLVTP